MIYKKFIRWLFGILLLGLHIPVLSQAQWTYDFNKGLNSMESGGPTLKKLGKPGQYIKEKIPGAEAVFRTVYRFENNSGLQFDNLEAKGFLNKSFSVEIYFKMDSLGSWKRVLDFKNRKSDYGSYIYDGKLNFYDYAISEKAPVKANQYVHYVYTRDFDTKVIKMYINGLSKVEFTDPGTEGVLDNDQVLNFFQDDLVANHEAGAGSVALIRIYDRVMTPVFVRRSFQSLSKPTAVIAVVPQEEAEEKTKTIKSIHSNPNLVDLSGKVYDAKNLAMIDNVDVSVRRIKNDSLVARTKTLNGTYIVQLPPYESYKVSVQAPGFETKTIAVSISKRSEEVKTLFSLTAEKYDHPLATILFTQSLEILESDAKTKLDSMVAYFQSRPDLRIMLKGHTDNIGDFDKNIELSKQRVETVKTYITSKGIDPKRIEGVGYGPTRPNSKNLTEEQKKINRRVEVWAESGK